MNIEEIVRRSGEILDYAVEMRRHFHRHPEPTSREFETVRFLCGQLDRMGISIFRMAESWPRFQEKDRRTVKRRPTCFCGRTVTL